MGRGRAGEGEGEGGVPHPFTRMTEFPFYAPSHPGPWAKSPSGIDAALLLSLLKESIWRWQIPANANNMPHVQPTSSRPRIRIHHLPPPFAQATSGDRNLYLIS